MNVIVYKQNNANGHYTSFNIKHYQNVAMTIGKKMKGTNLIQVIFNNGFQGSQIAKGYITVNTMFTLGHTSNVYTRFNKSIGKGGF